MASIESKEAARKLCPRETRLPDPNSTVGLFDIWQTLKKGQWISHFGHMVRMLLHILTALTSIKGEHFIS